MSELDRRPHCSLWTLLHCQVLSVDKEWSQHYSLWQYVSLVTLSCAWPHVMNIIQPRQDMDQCVVVKTQSVISYFHLLQATSKWNYKRSVVAKVIFELLIFAYTTTILPDCYSTFTRLNWRMCVFFSLCHDSSQRWGVFLCLLLWWEATDILGWLVQC